MSIFRGDASEIYALAQDLTAVSARMVPALRSAMDQAGREVAEAWATNAREHFSADGHAKKYPDSIDSELVFHASGVSVDIGPNTAKKHGFLGYVLEFGNEDSLPYLDGLRAMDATADRTEELVAAVIAGTFLATPVANAAELKAYTTKAGVTRTATQAQIDNWTRGGS